MSQRELSALSIARASYPSWKPVEGTEEAWQLLLADIPAPQLLVAVLAHCQTSRFPPSVSELREMAEIDEPTPEQVALQVEFARAASGSKALWYKADHGELSAIESNQLNQRYNQALTRITAQGKRERALAGAKKLVAGRLALQENVSSLELPPPRAST